MKTKNILRLALLSALSLGLGACGASFRKEVSNKNIPTSIEVSDTSTTKASEVDVYLSLTSVGLFDGQPGEKIESLFIENAVKYTAEVGSELPGKDRVTTIESSKGEFSHWAAYEGNGAPTIYTTVPNKNNLILQAVYAADGSGNASDIGGSTNEKMTVYFKTEGWTNANIYIWDATDTAPYAWPGTAMNSLGDGLFSFEYDTITYVNVIFNDGTQQTADLKSPTSEDADCYFWEIKDWRNEDYVVNEDDIPQPKVMKVYFKAPDTWNSANIYLWGTSTLFAWPGTSMSKDSATGLFYYEYDTTTYFNVIFNNGSEQTADLKSPTSEDTDCYFWDLKEWHNEDYVPNGSTPTPDPDPNPNPDPDPTPTPGSTTIYFKAPEWWCSDSAQVGFYYWGTGITGPAWPGLRCDVVDATNHIWSYTIDLTNLTGFIFTRINPSGAVADWGAKTIDLSVTAMGTNNMYDCSGCTTLIWGDPGCAGVWTTYTA